MNTHKIGRLNLIKENVCELNCDCGWNVSIGGANKEDLESLKALLKEHFPVQ